MGLILGMLFLAAAIALLLFGVLLPPRIRRSPLSDDPSEAAEGSVVAAVDRLFTRLTPPGLRRAMSADIAVASGVFTVGRASAIIALGTITIALVISALTTPVLGIAVFFAAPLIARLRLRQRADRQRRNFEEQLTDTLQLMASSLRAGNSILAAMESVSTQAAQPTAREFVRAVNEVRVGADIGTALDGIAERMRSVDFEWVGQAIDIHREVGGNLAEVLDQVGTTLRDRGHMRRQIRSLSADGRLSAVILVALPPIVLVVLLAVNPRFLDPMLATPVGWVLILVSLLLFAAGGLWIRRIVRLEL